MGLFNIHVIRGTVSVAGCTDKLSIAVIAGEGPGSLLVGTLEPEVVAIDKLTFHLHGQSELGVVECAPVGVVVIVVKSEFYGFDVQDARQIDIILRCGTNLSCWFLNFWCRWCFWCCFRFCLLGRCCCNLLGLCLIDNNGVVV